MGYAESNLSKRDYYKTICEHSLNFEITSRLKENLKTFDPDFKFYIAFYSNGNFEMHVVYPDGGDVSIEFPKINYCPVCGEALQPNPDLVAIPGRLHKKG